MSKVKIKGNASGTGVLTIEAPNTNTDSTITLPDGDVTLGVGIDDNATSTAITIDSSENVGIGTSSPEEKLHVEGSLKLDFGSAGANPRVYLDHDSATDDGNYLQLNRGDNGLEVVGQDNVKIRTSGSERMRIDSSGNVGIGTSNPTYPLEVSTAQNGAVKFITSHYDCLWVEQGQGGGGTCATMKRAGAGDIIRFNTSGQIGSITTNNSSTSYNTSSDYRLKENVVPMTGSIDRLKELKPSKFNFIADADKTVDGFLAHEAQEVVPEAITGTKDAMRTEEYEVEPAVMDGETEVTPAVMGEREVEDYQGIDQSKLVPLLTSALQEAVAKIEDLEKRIEILEAN